MIFENIKVVSSKFLILANVFLGWVGHVTVRGCSSGKEHGIQVLASLVQSSQPVGSLLITLCEQSQPEKLDKKVSLANWIQWKNALNCF
jgi:hypothetical protein